MVRDSGVEPSMLMPHITDSPYLRSEPSMLMLHIVDSSMQTKPTIRDKDTYHGWFRDLTTLFIRITATTDRQAGLTQSPAQPCRIVAAGDALFRRRCIR